MAGADRADSARREAGGRPLTLGFLARAALVVIGLWALANVLWVARDLLFVAFFATLVASFLSIFVRALQKVGVPRPVGVGIVLLSLVATVTGAVSLLWPTLQDQFAVIERQLPRALAEASTWAQEQYRAITGEFGRPTADVQAQIRQRINAEVADIIAGAIPLLNTVVGAAVGLLIVLFAGIYLTVEPRLYVEGLTRLVPPAGRVRVGRALNTVGRAVREWMLGTVLSMAVIGALTMLGLWVLGVPAALALGVIAGILEFIPYFGPVFSALPAVAVALTVSPIQALWVVLLYIAIQQLEGNLIYPLIMRGVVELPPALTILFQSLMAVLFGFLGLLLAVPILAVAKVLVRVLYIEPMESA